MANDLQENGAHQYSYHRQYEEQQEENILELWIPAIEEIESGSLVRDLYDPYNGYFKIDAYDAYSLYLGVIDTSLFSSCRIEYYYTSTDWKPFVEESMTEPAFFALSEEAVQIGCGLDGPNTDSILATAPFEISDGSYHDYDWNHAACVNIDLSEIEATMPLYLSSYTSTAGSIYVYKIAFYK